MTDLADTQYQGTAAHSHATGRNPVLVLLIPAEPKDALLTIGKRLSRPEQFDLRTRQLKETAPWIAIAPYFVHGLGKLLSGSDATIARAN